jgi:uncharacterized protein
MNKPATKEPSMDEILSSIRQIIADDDASAAPPPARPAIGAAPKPAPASGAEPLALSAAQIVSPAHQKPAPEASVADLSAMLSGLDEDEPEVSAPIAEIIADDAELLDPEDVTFETEQHVPEPVPSVARRADPPPARPAPRMPASVAHAAPMPDPTLSRDMAEELLAPTTDAAVHAAMARVSALPTGGIGGMTVEAMIRDMLRPMLKDWLDENLPSLVERVVEKEISRISRGVK